MYDFLRSSGEFAFLCDTFQLKTTKKADMKSQTEMAKRPRTDMLTRKRELMNDQYVNFAQYTVTINYN